MASKLLTRWLLPEASGRWSLPGGAYALTRTAHALRPLLLGLSRIETRRHRRRLAELSVDRPIYICGIARAGTTITLEMLHRHPAVATHRYYNLPLPYLPCWGTDLVRGLPLEDAGPVERIHQDGLLVTKDSPEGVEERLWMSFFDALHDETHSNVLDGGTQQPRFERFYRDHIRKLVLHQGRQRYIVKNNNNVARLEYLLRIFPDARFVLVVRDPVAHVASFVKQQRLFNKLCNHDPRLNKSLPIVGHFEFGPDLRFINVGRADDIARIREHWAAGHEVAAWATYWASIYGFLADRLEASPALAAAAFLLQYETLCRDSAETIDRLLAHTELAAGPFAPTKADFVARLHEPTYYQHGFSAVEEAQIREITHPVAARFGYGADGSAPRAPAGDTLADGEA